MDRWIFMDFRLPTTLDLVRVRDLGFTTAVLGVGDDADEVFAPRFAPSRYRVACDQLRAHGIRPVVMPWLKRDPDWMREVRDFIEDDFEGEEVLFDVEYGWRRSPFPVPDAVSLFGDLWGDYHGRLGVTSFASLPAEVAALAPHVQYGLPQAYSVHMKKQDTSSPVYRPKATQRYAWKKWKIHFDELVMGLAAYAQNHPVSPRGIDALEAAWQETVDLAHRTERIYAAAWWSWKHFDTRKREWMKGVAQ